MLVYFVFIEYLLMATKTISLYEILDRTDESLRRHVSNDKDTKLAMTLEDVIRRFKLRRSGPYIQY